MNRQETSWKKAHSGWFSRPAREVERSSSRTRKLLSHLTFGLIKQRAASNNSVVQPKSDFPARISLAYQFERVSQVVEDAVARGDAIQALHRQTAQQLDATEYALHRLFDEIHSVLPRFEKPVYNNAVVRTAEAETFHPTALAA